MKNESIYKLIEDDIGIPREITCYGDLQIHKGKVFYPTQIEGYHINEDGEVLGKLNKIIKSFSTNLRRKDGGYYQITMKDEKSELDIVFMFLR